MTKPKGKENACYFNDFIICERYGVNCDKCGYNPKEHKRRIVAIRAELLDTGCDADEIKEKLAAEAEEEAAAAPSLDVVSVTRCKNCEHWKRGEDYCTHPAGLCACGVMARNNYCIFGNARGGN